MRDDGISLDANAVRRELTLPADREVVWEALASAEGLSRWLGDEVDLEMREGAQGTISSGGGDVRQVTVEEIRAPRRLVLHWSAPAVEPSLVELTLEDVPGGTRIVVVEVPLVALRAVALEIQESMPPPSTSGPTMSARAAACASVA